MNSTAVQYAGALRHAGCTLSELRRTAGCLTGCAELWDALCSPAVSAREKKAVLARLPAFDARGELRHFYLLLADKNRFALLPEIVRQFRLLELRENGEGLCGCGVRRVGRGAHAAQQSRAKSCGSCSLHICINLS